jgi:uncharacterized protein (TIGR00290 family)
VVLSWSGGKDSALCLWALRQANEPVGTLLTTITDEYDRISMHGVRVSLLRQQADAVGLPLVEVRIPSSCTNELYEELMADALSSPQLRDCERYAFGDLFLEDVREYREERLATLGKRGVWPLWGRDTRILAGDFVDAGFNGVVVCVDPSKLDGDFCGRELNAEFLADLPSHVDPCGERGEFHTFVYDGPVFSQPLMIERAGIVERDGFIFCDWVQAQP